MTATNAGRKRPGRPAGSSNTRDRILASARELFARNGISNTSIRAVAAAADVDSALVHHYFGTKEQLFAAAVHIPIDPMDVIGPLREVPVEELGYKLPSMLLPLWDSEIGAGLIATLRSILAGTEAAPSRVPGSSGESFLDGFSLMSDFHEFTRGPRARDACRNPGRSKHVPDSFQEGRK